MVSNASEDLPEPGQAGDDDELVAGDVEVEALEVVLAGAADRYAVERQIRFLSGVWLTVEPPLYARSQERVRSRLAEARSRVGAMLRTTFLGGRRSFTASNASPKCLRNTAPVPLHRQGTRPAPSIRLNRPGTTREGGSSCLQSQHRRYRLAARLGSDGAVHDAGARSVLQRHGPRKNVLSTTMHSFFAMGLVGVIWAVVGYTLAFGDGQRRLAPFIGGLRLRRADGTSTASCSAPSRSPCSRCTRGCSPSSPSALITGAIAERMKFKAYVLFAACGRSSCTPRSPTGCGKPTAGCSSSARSTSPAVPSSTSPRRRQHSPARSCSASARGYGKEQIHPHNLPLTVLGAGILWFGWFGFNAGSALGANQLAGTAFMNTNIAAAAAMLTWMLAETFHAGKPTVLGAASGAVAGLVGVTPAAGFVEPWAALHHRCHRRVSRATSACSSRASSASTTRSTSWASTAWAARSARS